MSYDITLSRYYNRTEEYDQYEDYKVLLFRAGDALQSAELNEIQSILHKENVQLASNFLNNGKIISGGNVQIKSEVVGSNGTEPLYNNTISVDDSVIYLSTYYVKIPGTELYINNKVMSGVDGDLGIEVTYTEVTDSEDVTLKDPAVETRNYAQPGAGRLKVTGKWILKEDYLDSAEKEYISLFEIRDGELIDKVGRSIVENGMVNLIAKYDRNANGNYVVDGYEVSYLSKESDLGPFMVSVADGSANVYGWNYESEFSQDLEILPLVDFELKESEPVSFIGDGWYEPRHTPIRKVFRISGQKLIESEQKTHAYSGSSDELDNQPVNVILEVNDLADFSGKSYAEGTDWVQSGDSIAWLGNEEPLAGATFYVKYRYNYTETEGTFTGNNSDIYSIADSDYLHKIYIEGFTPGTSVSIDYDFVLQRVDSIFLDAKGKLGAVRGVPDESEPRSPSTDKDQTLKLANIQMGADFTPYVTQDSQRVFKMSDIQLLLDGIKSNEYNISRLALVQNLNENQPSSIFSNTFVDDFMDDDLRDDGLYPLNDEFNNALTVSGNLVLDINWENVAITNVLAPEQDAIAIPSVKSDVILNQPYWTKSRQINEYLFKAPPEAHIEIEPKVYRWVSRNNYTRYVSSRQTSTVTRNSWTWRWRWWGWRSTTVSTSVSRQSLGTSSRTTSSISTSRHPEIIPRIRIRIKSDVGDFNSNEVVDIKFAGKVAASLTTDSNGKLDGTFLVPAHQYSGNKKVEAKGRVSTTTGGTTFQATPLVRNIHTTITHWWRWVVQRRWTRWWNRDPVAETFQINETSAIDGIGIYFEKPPTTPVSVVITETTAGFPDKSKALVSKTLPVSACQDTHGDTYFAFDTKPTLIKDTEYAFIVICDDADGRVKCARLGERDNEHGLWITNQAYSVGVMFNSSNNSVWTPLQEEDMKFYIRSAEFNTSYTHVMPTVDVENATDLMLLANAKVDEGTSIQYRVDLLDRSFDNTYTVNSYSQFPLDTKYTGRVRVSALFSSDGLRSPQLDPNVQLSVGTCEQSSVYTSRAFNFDPDAVICDVYLDMYKPANTNVIVQYDNDGVFTEIPLQAEDTKPLGDGWVENHFVLENVTAPNSGDTRVRIIMSTTNDKDRPVVGNLRFTTQKI